MRRLSWLVLLVALLVACADWLFYGQPLGWSLSLVCVAGTMAVIARGGAHLVSRGALVCGAALAGLITALAAQPGPLVFVMTVAALAAFTIIVREGIAQDAVAMAARLCAFGIKASLQTLLDLPLLRRLLRRRAIDSAGAAVGRWILPLAGSVLFLAIFSIANPLLSRELSRMDSLLQQFFTHSQIGFDRVFLWCFTAAAAWALLRVRCRVKPSTRLQQPQAFLTPPRVSFLVRCLALFNCVFAVQSLLDVTYLFGGMQLPDGMTYAEYAHRGAYPLVLTALLAAGFVLAAYRPGVPTRETRTARRLVLLWLAQNIFLTFSAAWRLHIYTNIYSLTRLRVAAGIWMLLVALGLAWIGLRIVSGRSNRWLVSRNLATTAIVLYLCCFVNFEGMIAWHNARDCRESTGSGTQLDYAYMLSLGPEALPALRWLKDRGRYHPPSIVDPIGMHETTLNAWMSNWRSRSLRRWMLWNAAQSSSAPIAANR